MAPTLTQRNYLTLIRRSTIRKSAWPLLAYVSCANSGANL